MKNPLKLKVLWDFIMRHPDNRAQAPFVAAAALVFAGILSFLWMPEAISRGTVMDRMKALDENIARINSDTRSAALYSGLSDEAGWVEDRISTNAGEGDIIMKINSVAKQAGIKLSVENAAREKDPPAGFEAGSQSLVLTGSYIGLRRFIYGLGGVDVLTVIRKARIERAGRQPGAVKAWIDLAYFRKNAGRGAR